MDASQIVAGKVYEDRDGLSRYVVSIEPAGKRREARVTWRRPGGFAIRLVTDSMPHFLKHVARVDQSQWAEYAERLPNGGMATTQTSEAARQSATSTDAEQEGA